MAVYLKGRHREIDRFPVLGWALGLLAAFAAVSASLRAKRRDLHRSLSHVAYVVMVYLSVFNAELQRRRMQWNVQLEQGERGKVFQGRSSGLQPLRAW